MTARFAVAEATSISVDAWDAFVAAQRARTVAHGSAFRTLETIWRGVEDVSLVVREGERLVAIVPLFLETSRELRILTVRRLVGGTISGSGVLIDDAVPASQHRELYEVVADALASLAARRGVDDAQLTYPLLWGDRTSLAHFRQHPLAEFGYPDTPVLAMALDLRVSEAQLLAGLNATTRNLVRKAVKQGVEMRPIDSEAQWLAAESLSRETLGEGAMSREALECVWRRLITPGHAFALGAYEGETLISVVCVTGIGAQAYYCLGFNTARGLELNANRLALWHAILEAKARGVCMFEVGGLFFGASKEAAISRFKQAFGGRVYYLPSGRTVYRPVRAMLRGLVGAAYHRLRSAATRVNGARS